MLIESAGWPRRSLRAPFLQEPVSPAAHAGARRWLWALLVHAYPVVASNLVIAVLAPGPRAGAALREDAERVDTKGIQMSETTPFLNF
jgi:hypothetical protein